MLAFLEAYEAIRTRYNIPTEDIWNMDETGTAISVCNNTVVIRDSSKKKAYVKSPENREWVSTIKAISAAG